MTRLLDTRLGYLRFLAIPTRSMGNGIHRAVDHAGHYACFDSVIEEYLIGEAGVDLRTGDVTAYVIESRCRFHRPLSSPDTIDAGLRVGHLGTCSVRYEIGLFRRDEDKAAASGYVVHVFADRTRNKPIAIPASIRAALEKLRLPS